MARTLCASSLDEFREMEGEWRAVSGTCAPALFSTFDLVEHWYRCFARPDQIRVYGLGQPAECIGYLPLVRRTFMGVRVLAPLANSHCFHARGLVRNGWEARFPALAQEALSGDRHGWDALQHDYSYSFDRLPPLAQPVDAGWDGVSVQPSVEPTFVIRLRSSFDEYMHGDLSKKNRNAVSRFRNRMKRAGAFGLRVCAGTDLARSWATFVEIEDSGWKGRRGSSIRRCAPSVSHYYEGLVSLLTTLGVGTLFFLDLEGEPIAAAFGYRDDRVFHCWKMSYLEARAEYAPALVLLNLVVEWLIANCQGLQLLHLFPGDYGYKHRFVNEAAASRGARVFNGTGRGHLVHAAWAAKRTVRQLVSGPSREGGSETGTPVREDEEDAV